MIDVFIRTNTTIPDVRQALSGLTCRRVKIRNGGPTEVWQRTDADGWQKDQRPGLTLYSDLTSDYIDFTAYRYDRARVTSFPMADTPILRLQNDEAVEWLASMRQHQYELEDAIGCSVDVLDAGVNITCAASEFPISEFKNYLYPNQPIGKKILTWIDQILDAGADQIFVSISVRK